MPCKADETARGTSKQCFTSLRHPPRNPTGSTRSPPPVRMKRASWHSNSVRRLKEPTTPLPLVPIPSQGPGIFDWEERYRPHPPPSRHESTAVYRDVASSTQEPLQFHKPAAYKYKVLSAFSVRLSPCQMSLGVQHDSGWLPPAQSKTVARRSRSRQASPSQRLLRMVTRDRKEYAQGPLRPSASCGRGPPHSFSPGNCWRTPTPYEQEPIRT